MATNNVKIFKKYQENLDENYKNGLEDFGSFLNDCGFNLTRDEENKILDEEVKPDIDNGLKALILASVSGNTDALVTLGDLYGEGSKLNKDMYMSFWCYKLAADKGNVNGMVNLADYYKHGKAYKKNLDESFKYYELAMNNGSLRGEYELAQFYLESNKPVAKDKIYAIKLLYDVVEKENEYANSVADPHCLNEVTTELGWNAQSEIDYIIVNIKKNDYKGDESDKIMDLIYNYYDPFRAINLSARLGLSGIRECCGKTSDYLYHLQASMCDDWKFDFLEEVGRYFPNANLFLANNALELAFFDYEDKDFFESQCREALNYLDKNKISHCDMNCVLVGDIYLNGFGVKPNFYEAFTRYSYAMGECEFAKFKIAKMFYYGFYVKKNVLTALSKIYDLDYAKVDKYREVYGPGFSSSDDFDNFINKRSMDEELAKLTAQDVNKENIEFLERLAKENERAKALLDKVDKDKLSSEIKYVWRYDIDCEPLLDYVSSKNTITSKDIYKVCGELDVFYEVTAFLRDHNITIDDSKDLKELQDSLGLKVR